MSEEICVLEKKNKREKMILNDVAGTCVNFKALGELLIPTTV